MNRQPIDLASGYRIKMIADQLYVRRNRPRSRQSGIKPLNEVTVALKLVSNLN